MFRCFTRVSIKEKRGKIAMFYSCLIYFTTSSLSFSLNEGTQSIDNPYFKSDLLFYNYSLFVILKPNIINIKVGRFGQDVNQTKHNATYTSKCLSFQTLLVSSEYDIAFVYTQSTLLSVYVF